MVRLTDNFIIALIYRTTYFINHMLASKNKFGVFLLVIFLFIKQQSYGQRITSDQTGINNGFYYSFWNDRASGSAFMLLKPNGRYKTVWYNIGNFTAGRGWAIGKADRIIIFSGSFDGGENGFLAVYGWTRNPLIEYYVVENYGAWVPPGGISKGTFSSDGGTYNIYHTIRTNQPSIDGKQTFQQYWSVRMTKHSTGTVTFANHVAAWKSKGMSLGTTWDYQIIESEGSKSSGRSDITVGELSSSKVQSANK